MSRDYIDWDAFNRAADAYDRETDRMIEERYADGEPEENESEDENE